MPKEIERKFLIANESWRQTNLHHVNLRDGLLAFSDGRKVRIRFYDDRATLTVKGRRDGISRDEFEYDIPSCDGLILLEQHCDGEIVEKTRHYLSFGGFEWSIDEYHGLLSGIIIAEIELPAEETAFLHPAWLGREVTGQDEYRKINMIRAARAGNLPPA